MTPLFYTIPDYIYNNNWIHTLWKKLMEIDFKMNIKYKLTFKSPKISQNNNSIHQIVNIIHPKNKKQKMESNLHHLYHYIICLKDKNIQRNLSYK